MLFCDPAGARTQDPYIKSVMLYQLSYGIFLLVKAVQRYNLFFMYQIKKGLYLIILCI
jgi:hypothetical protein